jgi:hypothetical protein
VSPWLIGSDLALEALRDRFAVEDYPSNLVDVLVLCVGLVLIVWIGMRRSRVRSATSPWPVVAKVGLIVWLAVFAFALYLVFG